MHKIIKLFLVVSLMIFSLSFQNTQVNAATNSPMSTIETLVKLINQESWQSIPELWVSDMKAGISPFFSSNENKQNHKGLFNIKKAKLLDWKELSYEEASPYTTVHDNARYFYFSIDNSVHKDDKYHMNGINYYLSALVQENGEWKIAQFSTAPVDIFVANKIGFSTEDEKKLAENFEKRNEGKFLNRKGEILETNANTNTLKSNKINIVDEPKNLIGSENISLLAANDHTVPGYIDVYITNPKNGNIGSTAMPSFYYYVENVLPNEWGPAWTTESLRAGALAVKMYGWYAVYYPLASAVGCDVYDDTRSQVYIVGTAVTKTTLAVNDTIGKGLHRGDNGQLFLTEYIAGSLSEGGKAGGKVWQYGSKYFADLGWTHTSILNYYYDGSTKVGGTGKYYVYFYY